MKSAKKNNPEGLDIAGLILTGGGARGAYQVGVLKAISEMIEFDDNPFPVISGISVGAINAAALATRAEDFQRAVTELEALWLGLDTSKIYETRTARLIKNNLVILASFVFKRLKRSRPRSLLDCSPLQDYLTQNLDFEGIDRSVAAGQLKALTLSASGYASARAISFYEGEENLRPWKRLRREGRPADIQVDHVMASAALPFVFPSVRIGDEYFGDGALRLAAPLSPAIHLGANKLLVIGLRDNSALDKPDSPEYPTYGELGGYALDIIFNDKLDSDIERLRRINQTLDVMDPSKVKSTELQPVELLRIRPSMDLRLLADEHMDKTPTNVRRLLRMLGSWGKGKRLMSYLLFEPAYIRSLISLGYRDGLARREELTSFLTNGQDSASNHYQ